jgi:heme/copper-type cytochrome/quinol oxidase subunit 2
VTLAAGLPLVFLLTGCATKTEHRTIAATVDAGTSGYFPAQITVQKEDRIVLRVGNGTSQTHGFSIEGYKIQRTVDPNQTLELRFRAGRGGAFKIYCQLHESHLPATLVVE